MRVVPRSDEKHGYETTPPALTEVRRATIGTPTLIDAFSTLLKYGAMKQRCDVLKCITIIEHSSRVYFIFLLNFGMSVAFGQAVPSESILTAFA
jgi:hypothetical protein